MKNSHSLVKTLMQLIASQAILMFALAGCGGGGGGGGVSGGGSAVSHNLWTLVTGSSIANQIPVYGSKGVAAATNAPGARSGAVSWIDGSGNRWLFGGLGMSASGAGGSSLNDLWKFDGTNWTWMGGSSLSNQYGVYGTQGVAAASNMPGARNGAVSWIDNNGKFWLFGGYGLSSNGIGDLNDLWKFDGTNWTWVSGSNLSFQSGAYGTKGTAAAANSPGARDSAVSWIDGTGNRWLFGGQGRDSAGFQGNLNDLWKFDGTNWTWMGGSNVANQKGVYGAKGTAFASNIPGARIGAVSLIDGNGNRWLFGGQGYDSAGTVGVLNDLWKFDGTNWTWISGSNLTVQQGNYGTLGVAAAGNIPGARVNSVGWVDSSGKIWLFGGNGYDSIGQYGTLNDLWRFDGTNWTWMTGSNVHSQAGVYSPPGTTPGNRYDSSAWIDSNGKLWLYGGMSLVSGWLNDLWSYQP